MSSLMGLLACEAWKKSAARARTCALLCGALLMTAPLKAQAPEPLPATPKKPVVDEYHTTAGWRIGTIPPCARGATRKTSGRARIWMVWRCASRFASGCVRLPTRPR